MKRGNRMMVTARTITLCILTSLVLVACGSSPPVRYYALAPMSTEPRQEANDPVVLGLGPLSMPEYLNRSQIVTRGAGAEMNVDEYSRWAEPLGPALHRIVSTDVDNLLDGVVVVAFPYDSMIRAQVNYRVLGEVSRFDADQSGQVILEVLWGVSEVGADVVVAPHRSHYKAQAASAGNPATMAEAMNEALLLFSQDIASKLDAVLK
jgi:uncharacterized lipoprotein YmbA